MDNCRLFSILVQLLCIILFILFIITLVILRDKEKLVWTCIFDNYTQSKVCE